MGSPSLDRLDLWDYRRRVGEIYRQVRAADDPEQGWRLWREGRDHLFRTHPQSPVPPEAREGFPTLPHHPYDRAWRLEGEVEPVEQEAEAVPHSGSGSNPFRRLGEVAVETPAGPARLLLLWLDTYGGGVFLPFRDASNGSATYGGGRYLLDTAKGADLGHDGRRIVLDFNFAYHPSCVHDPRWSCPLAPPRNVLPFPVPVGEVLAGGTEPPADG